MANDINVQDTFLQKVKAEKSLVAVFFEKVKMLGIVKDFDQFSITLDSNGQDQMIYKQGINYIGLQKPKKSFKPRPGNFRPREAREGDASSEGQSPQDGPRKSFSPRPRPDSEYRSSEHSGFRKPEDRRSSQGERRPDPQTSSYKSRDSYQNKDSSPRSPSQSSDEPKKVFRVQKPFTRKD
ncbi:MAG: RNA chaperone Hfq [Acidobacteria bacterium]|nr:RNA chaperone Hfq [Acidobacteriota bacterium]